jgi:SAM-dependent methyltransferase
MPDHDPTKPHQPALFGASDGDAHAIPPGVALPPPAGPPRTTPFSDIDLHRWKDYEEVLTGSLWILGARDQSGPHRGDYWGNFVPQIPRQALLRFTKAGEVVVDLFSGMGTTLIECRRLGRHGIGVELNPAVAEASRERIGQAENPAAIFTEALVGDASAPETIQAVRQRLASLGHAHAHCVILHPPYHNIIAFSQDARDLSCCASLEEFLARFAIVVAHARDLLAPGRFLALVIGDMYAQGEWVPLGFECMQVCRQVGLRLKAINVKDMRGNERGKGANENLWKYRALVAGTYLFKHEYVMIFQKPAVSPARPRPKAKPASGREE